MRGEFDEFNARMAANASPDQKSDALLLRSAFGENLKNFISENEAIAIFSRIKNRNENFSNILGWSFTIISFFCFYLAIVTKNDFGENKSFDFLIYGILLYGCAYIQDWFFKKLSFSQSKGEMNQVISIKMNNMRPSSNFDTDKIRGDTTTMSDSDFAFDADRFRSTPPPHSQQTKPTPQPPSQPDENAPRGYDKRHPDDAELWAFVDDPETPEEEALSALRKIHQRERQRKQGKKPSDVKGFLSGR